MHHGQAEEGAEDDQQAPPAAGRQRGAPLQEQEQEQEQECQRGAPPQQELEQQEQEQKQEQEQEQKQVPQPQSQLLWGPRARQQPAQPQAEPQP